MSSVPPVPTPAFGHYRLYKTDRDGHFIDVREFGATSDLAAIDIALPPTGALELWAGDRRIMEFPTEVHEEFVGDHKLYDEATTVTAKGGEVSLKGPDGVDVIITPEAAERTSRRLIQQAEVARSQRRLPGNPPRAAERPLRGRMS